MIPILDASFVVKTALDEEHEPRADTARRVLQDLMERGRVGAPSLLPWEIGQVAHVKHPDRFGSSLQDRLAVVEALLAGIELHTPDHRATAAAGRIAEGAGLTFYDAAYLELADREPDRVLITEDQDLLVAGRRLLGQDRCLDAASAWQAIQDGRI